MTPSVQPPVLPPGRPGADAILAPQSDGEVPRMPATELSQVSNGGSVFGTATNAEVHDETDRDPFKLSSAYAYKPRKMKVFTIGAGFSGLLMAHKIQHRFPDMGDIVEHTIFEARSEVGGTWFVNNYPGVQCDVPAHIYVRH